MTLDAIVIGVLFLIAAWWVYLLVVAIVAEILDEIERWRVHRLQPPWLFKLDLAGARKRRRRSAR